MRIKYFLLSFLFISPAIFAHDDTRMANAELLGWINTPGKNICGGYFSDPYMFGVNSILPPLNSTSVHIHANQGNWLYNGQSVLSGHIVVTQPGRRVSADQVKFDTHNGNVNIIDVTGHVLLHEQGKVVAAQSGTVNLQSDTYKLGQVIYRLFLNQQGAWGKAQKITEPLSGITHLQHVTYSTCPPQSRAWDLSASSLDLNRQTGRGYAHNAVLYVHDVPIMYTPYFNFPITSARQTGVLFPEFSTSTTSGFGFGVPYYWNIAPNMDDTFMPYIYTKRGLQLNNQYRYLTATSNGALNLSFLPDDVGFRQFQQSEPSQVPAGTPGIQALQNASANRNFVGFTDISQFNPNWSANVNYNRVSDDYYPQDFNNVPQAATNQLLQQGSIQYQAQNWNFLGNLQAYQTLHPINEAFVANQYSMLPQLLFSSQLPIKNNALNYGSQLEMVNFEEAPNPGQIQTPPTGQRFNFIPDINLPLENAAGYVTPQVQFELTQYNLGDQPVGNANQITRSVPITDIDSGLYFERASGGYTETLEPRFYYLYVPYHNQSDIPVFDSAIQPFTYNQLFLTNRFTGSDRIGDANQISFALETHVDSQQTGDQKFSAGVGAIKYFENRRVTICSTPGCQDSLYAVGSTSPTETFSPVVGQMNYTFNPNWHALSNAAWDAYNGQWQNANLAFQYMPLPNHIFNLGYSFVRYGDIYSLPGQVQSNNMLPPNSSQNNLSEPEVSMMWPVTERVSLLGSWSYSLNQQHAQTYFYGAQYNSCCWAAQVVVAHTFLDLNNNGQPQFSTGVYAQIALKGLGSVAANDPTGLLTSDIPGYQNTLFSQTV